MAQEKKKNQDVERQELVLQPLRSMINLFRWKKYLVTVNQKPFEASKTSLYGPKYDKFEDGKRPSNCGTTSNPSLDDKELLKEFENVEGLQSQNPPKEDKKIDGGHRQQKFDENYGWNSGVPFWFNTRCDYEDDFMKKIKNWQFNPLADERDEWPTEPRFNPFLRSTMMSDTPDNETKHQDYSYNRRGAKVEGPGGGSLNT